MANPYEQMVEPVLYEPDAPAAPAKSANPYEQMVEEPRERGRAALNGFTFGLGPRVMAAARYATLGEGWEEAKQKEYKLLDDYRHARPWEAAGFEIAGSLPTLAIPGVGQLGNANRIRMGVQAARGGAAARATAQQASVTNLAHEVGRGGAQLGATQGALHSRDYTDVPDVLQNAAVGGGVGYVGGRVVHNVVEPVINIARNTAEAIAVGSSARGAANRSLRESVGEQGTDLATAARSYYPAPRNMTAQAQEAIVNTYHEALANGQTEAAARAAATAAYAPLAGGRAQSTIDQHVANAIADYQTHNRVPLIAAEVLNGGERPLQGEMQAMTQSLMKTGSGAGSHLKEVTGARSEGAINRMRELVDETVGANIPGGGRDYVGGMTHIQDSSRAARTHAYNQAREAALPFDIGPSLTRTEQLAQRDLYGNDQAAVQNTINGIRSWMDRQRALLSRPEARTPGYTEHVAMLESFKNMRSQLQGEIDQAHQSGNRNLGRVLQGLRDDIDDIARTTNPVWSQVNDAAAQSYRIPEAAAVGHTTPLAEGPKAQTLRARMTGERVVDDKGAPLHPFTMPEREAARMGYGRQIHDQLSRLGDDNNPARLFRKGGDDSEGPRATIGTMIDAARQDSATIAAARSAERGSGVRAQQSAAQRAREAIPDVEEFIRNVEREHIAATTNALSGNSATSTVQAHQAKRNALINAAITMMHNVNPLQAFQALSKMMVERAGRARDEELARMLAITTDRPHDLARLIQELQRTAPGMRDPWAPAVSEWAAHAIPYAAGNFGEQMTLPPQRRRQIGAMR